MNEKSIFDKRLTFYNLLDIALKRWYLTVSITVVTLILSIIYSFLYISPSYSSTAKLYIINKGENVLSSGDLAVSTSIAKDFEVIITDDSIIGEVAEKLNYKYSASQIKNLITVDNPDSTRVIELTVVSPDPEVSKLITSSLCEIAQDKIIDLMGVDRISVISEGTITVEPARTKQTKVVVLGLLGGLGISFLLLTFLSLTSNKISSAKDIEEILELNVLATIPYNKNKRAKN